MRKCGNWEKKLRTKLLIPRTIDLGQNMFKVIDIHVSEDENLLESCAVAYAVTQQPSEIK